MKTDSIKTIIFAALMSSILIFGIGCTKKDVMPPLSGSASSDGVDMSSGNDIEYPAADGYSEESLEGSLDDTGFSGGADGTGAYGADADGYGSNSYGNMTVDSSTDQATRDYLIEHGRCSENLLPVYFDYDQIRVRDDQSERLVSNAAYLQQTGVNVVVEGNCDQRGTNEYNLALGERRALAVKKYLIELGVDESRITTISYGEERPLFLEQDEFSLSQNRRVDFVAQ
ncbi:MAG: hypothetical protein CSB24_01280 [Deltaproteobacteria bacterium]|nr:MAG: hypothetical protein CSB24_01280 [Deltaproteobacteria bacterium]